MMSTLRHTWQGFAAQVWVEQEHYHYEMTGLALLFLYAVVYVLGSSANNKIALNWAKAFTTSDGHNIFHREFAQVQVLYVVPAEMGSRAEERPRGTVLAAVCFPPGVGPSAVGSVKPQSGNKQWDGTRAKRLL
jgi:hypothetical protein